MNGTTEVTIDDRNEAIEIVFEGLNENQGLALLHLRGYVDIQNYRYLHRQIDKIIDLDYVNLIFDFERLSFLSSTGIGAFADFLKSVKGRGGDMVVYAVQRRVQEVIDLLGFTKFFNKKETLEEALEHFSQGQTNAGTLFPRSFACPICGRGLRARKPGRFRCPDCRSVLEVHDSGCLYVG